MSDVNEGRDSSRTIISTAGEKGLPAVLVADRENVMVLIGWSSGPHIFIEPVLELLDAESKTLLVGSLTTAAEFVASSMTSQVYLPQCRYLRATLAARLWGSFRRKVQGRQHILKKAAALDARLLVGVRTIDAKTKMEVIFEEALLERLLNSTAKTGLREALNRASHVVEIRGGRTLKVRAPE